MSYVDLHLHLLPGLDDGPRSLEQSVAYARRLVREGVREATVTPHIGSEWPVDPAEVPERTAALQRELDAELGPVLRLHPGGELFGHRAASWSDAQLDHVAHGPPGARWLLVEVPFGGIDEAFLAACDELRARGWGLLIAHPERAAGFLPTGFALLRGQIAQGGVLQVSVDSLLGNHGLVVQDAAVHLLRSGLAYVVASDAHPGSRDHTQRLGLDLVLRAGGSSVQAWRLTQANPRFLLHQGIAQRMPLVPARARAVAR